MLKRFDALDYEHLATDWEVAGSNKDSNNYTKGRGAVELIILSSLGYERKKPKSTTS